MRRFARIGGWLRKRGRRIGDPDVMIAATALPHDLTLVTRNLDHFRRVPDLRVYGADQLTAIAILARMLPGPRT